MTRLICLLQVLIGILLPPYILFLDFKSKEELQLMPQTMEEHLDELEDDASEDHASISSFEDDQVRGCKKKFSGFMHLSIFSLR